MVVDGIGATVGDIVGRVTDAVRTATLFPRISAGLLTDDESFQHLILLSSVSHHIVITCSQSFPWGHFNCEN